MINPEKQEIEENLQTLLGRSREETKLTLWITHLDKQGYLEDRPKETSFANFLLVQNELIRNSFWDAALKNYDVLTSRVIELQPNVEKVVEQICQEIDKMDLLNREEALKKELKRQAKKKVPEAPIEEASVEDHSEEAPAEDPESDPVVDVPEETPEAPAEEVDPKEKAFADFDKKEEKTPQQS